MTLSVTLTHRFPGLALDIAFAAPPGVTALFGRSGSGKTTVINAIAGLFRPEAGRITLGEEVLLDTAAGRNLPPQQRRMGYVFQDARLFPHLTVRQNLRYGGWFRRERPAAGAFDRIVEMLGIGPLLSRRPGALSGGEKSRVALGRALLAAPRMLLLDEPLAALDEARKAEILPYLERLRDEASVPILHVSHSMAEVTRLAQNVVLIEGGRCLASGPVAEVFARAGGLAGLPPREAGAVITTRVAGPEADGLTRLETAAGPLWLEAPHLVPGEIQRLHILAQDVMLARARPEGLSALNILPLRVTELTETGAQVLVRLQLGEEALLSRITARSARALALAPGTPVFAILKAVALSA